MSTRPNARELVDLVLDPVLDRGAAVPGRCQEPDTRLNARLTGYRGLGLGLA